MWVAMITSAENRPWTGDVAIKNDPATGLQTPSVVRPAKIATIDARDAEPIGRVGASLVAKVIAEVARRVGAAPVR